MTTNLSEPGFSARRAIDELERLLAREPDLLERMLIVTHVTSWARDYCGDMHLRLTGQRHPLDDRRA